MAKKRKSVRERGIAPPVLIHPRREHLRSDLIPLPIRPPLPLETSPTPHLDYNRPRRTRPRSTSLDDAPLVPSDTTTSTRSSKPDLVKKKKNKKKAQKAKDIFKSIPKMLRRAFDGVKKRLSKRGENIRKQRRSMSVRPPAKQDMVPEAHTDATPPSSTTKLLRPHPPPPPIGSTPSLRPRPILVPPPLFRPTGSPRPSRTPPVDHTDDVVATVSRYFSTAVKDTPDSTTTATAGADKTQPPYLIPNYKYFGKAPWHQSRQQHQRHGGGGGECSDTKTVASTVPSSVIRILRGRTPPSTVDIPPVAAAVEGAGICKQTITVPMPSPDFPSGEASPVPLPHNRTDASDVALAESRYDFRPPGLLCMSQVDLLCPSPPNTAVDTNFADTTRRVVDAHFGVLRHCGPAEDDDRDGGAGYDDGRDGYGDWGAGIGIAITRTSTGETGFVSCASDSREYGGQGQEPGSRAEEEIVKSIRCLPG